MSGSVLSYLGHAIALGAMLGLAGTGWSAPAESGPRAGVGIWETGRTAAQPLTAQAVSSRGGWRRIGRGQGPAALRGDVVLSNGRLAAVFRRQAGEVELYALSGPEPAMRARLTLLSASGDPAQQLQTVAVTENTRGAVAVEVSYRAKAGQTIAARFRLKRAQVMIGVAPKEGAGRLRVGCTGRFVVLPDFFADDILIDARRMPGDSVELPSENFVLHLTADGQAIVMCSFENQQQEVRVWLTGSGAERTASGSEIDFGEQQRIWVAVLAADGIWQQFEVREEDGNRVRPLGWRMPFAAQWRVDFTRACGLTDSWEMLLPDRDGYLKPTWLGPGGTHIGPDRKRWTTVLGRFRYPCWIDRGGQGYVQPLKHRAVVFAGPAVIYPINRVAATPIEEYTVVDVARNSLGVGPCQYVLKIEGQKQEYKGRATCAVRDALQAIYRAGQQRQRRAEVEKALDDGLAFVTHIRSRIERYMQFGRQMRQYLGQQRRLHPELAEFLDQMDRIAAEFQARYNARRERIKTPQFVAAMNRDFRSSLLDYTGPDVLTRLKQYTSALTRIGGNQDELVGECRWVARTLRQQAGLMMATDPRCEPIAEHIRAECQKVMLKPASYEAARH